jgi:hypothetical protein
MTKPKKGLTAAAILAADDLPTIWIQTPEWGKNSGVWVRGMSGAERDEFEMRVSGLDGGGNQVKMNYINLRASLVASCVVDDDGKRLFSGDQVEALGRKSGAVLDRLFDASRKASGIGEDDVKALSKN